MEKDKYMSRLDRKVDEFVKFQMGNRKSEDPLLDLAAEVKDLADLVVEQRRSGEIYVNGITAPDGRQWAELESLQEAVNELRDEAFRDGIRIGILRERKRLRFRAFLADEGPWFWIVVGMMMMAIASVLAVGLAR